MLHVQEFYAGLPAPFVPGQRNTRVATGDDSQPDVLSVAGARGAQGNFRTAFPYVEKQYAGAVEIG